MLAAGGLVAILAAVFAYNSATPFPGVAALLPCAGAALVIHAGIAPNRTMTSRLLGSAPLVLVGLMSYSLYLWHWPLLAFAKYYYLSTLSAVTTGAVVALSVLFAYLAWRFVERPVRTRVMFTTRRPLLIAFGASTVALMLFAEAGDRSGGWGQRFAGVPVIDYDSVVADIGRDPAGCFMQASRNPSWDAAACTHAAARAAAVPPRRLFLVGDSFAAQFSGWLRSNFPGTVVELTSASCPPLFDFTSAVHTRWCDAVNAMRFDALRGGRFTDVFLGAWWGQTQNPATMGALERTVRRIRQAGVDRVVVLGTAPHFADSPIDVENRKRAFGRTGGATLTTDSYMEYRAALDRIARIGGVRVLNVDEWLCRDNECPYMLNGQMLFVDGAAHLTRPGVGYVMERADWMSTGTSSAPVFQH
jgi:hypothetical protein